MQGTLPESLGRSPAHGRGRPSLPGGFWLPWPRSYVPSQSSHSPLRSARPGASTCGRCTFIEERFPEALYGFFLFFTTLGYYRVVGALAIVAGAVFLLLGWRLSAAVIVVSSFGGMAATTALKYLFGRARPDFIDSGYMAGWLSFPSGHATMAVGFYGVLAAILFLKLAGPKRWLVLALGAGTALMIGLSRLYLGVHYPSDVLAGYLVSPAVVTLFLLGYASFGGRVGESGGDLREDP